MFELLFPLYYVSHLPTILSLILQLTISLIAFWKLKDLKKKHFSTDSIFECNPFFLKRFSFNCKKFIKEYLFFRKKFQELESKLSLIVLLRFVYTVNSLFYFVFYANSSQSFRWLYLTQSILTLATLFAFCWIHGLPHEVSKQMSQEFDIYLFDVDKNEVLNAKLILSKSSVGFHLLGVKYAIGLIGPVLAFILSNVVILVQTQK